MQVEKLEKVYNYWIETHFAILFTQLKGVSKESMFMELNFVARAKKNSTKSLLFAVLFSGLLFISVPLTFADQIVITSDVQFGFARTCMERYEYNRAVGEFEKFIYLFPKDSKVPEAQYLIGICYLKNKQPEAAIEAFSRIVMSNPGSLLTGKALLLTGESYYQQGVLKEAEYYFGQVIEKYALSDLKNAALYRLGWAKMYENKWGDASEIFGKISKKSIFYYSAQELAEQSLKGETLSIKNPAVAGSLAALVPGLGHAYVYRYKDAAISFLLNGLFIWAAIESFHQDHEVLGCMLTFLEAGWYTGNIYSAANAAHKNNRKVRNDFRKSFKDRFGLHLFTTGKNDLGLALTFQF
ncbi:MAG TPA: hypothetical protein DDW42_06610 [Desulfobacteraceae bacterium]|nr:hypothetical protein [Desulfobacteraceae bacterium]